MKRIVIATACMLVMVASAFATGAQEDVRDDAPARVVSIWRDWGQVRQTPFSEKMHGLIAERVGIDIEQVLVPIAEVATKMNLMLSANEQLDFVYLYNPGQTLPLHKRGLLADLTDLAPIHLTNMLEYYPIGSSQYEMSTYKGVLYQVPYGDVYQVWNGIYVRTDWLQRAGLAMPRTLAEYENVLRVFYEGRFSGGTDRVAPLAAADNPLQDLTNNVANFILPNGAGGSYGANWWAGGGWWIDSAGNLVPPEGDPAYEEVLATLARWYQAGYIPADLFTSSVEQRKQWAAQNRVGTYMGHHTTLIHSGFEVLRRENPQVDVTLMPVIQGRAGAASAYMRDNVSVHGVVIFEESEVPERILDYIDMHFTYEDGYEFLAYGIEGESFERDGGGYNFIGASEPKDWRSAPYYFGWNLFVSGSPALQEHVDQYPHSEDDFISWWSQREGERSLTVDVWEPIDVKVVYDASLFESQNRLNDLKTFFDENKVRIITGAIPASEWPAIYRQWLDLGGRDLIADKTAQYRAY